MSRDRNICEMLSPAKYVSLGETEVRQSFTFSLFLQALYSEIRLNATETLKEVIITGIFSLTSMGKLPIYSTFSLAWVPFDGVLEKI